MTNTELNGKNHVIQQGDNTRRTGKHSFVRILNEKNASFTADEAHQNIVLVKPLILKPYFHICASCKQMFGLYIIEPNISALVTHPCKSEQVI